MGRRLGSWDELSGSGASFIDGWKKDGFLKLVLHRDPPWVRSVHNFRRVVKDEEKGKLVKKVLWLPFVCHEDEAYHKLRRIEKDDPPSAENCPACRFIEHLEERDDIADDDVIFLFKGSGRGETREIQKVDFLGLSDTKRGFQDNFSAKTDYVIGVIPLDDPTAVKLTNERWSLGKSLIGRIKKDRKIYGDEEDPAKKPISYTFEYDEDQQKYGVSRLEGVEVTDEMHALWESDGPDASSFIAPTNPKTLLESMKDGAKFDFPFDDIFGPALEKWKERDDEETDFDPEKIEQEGKGAKSKSSKGNSKSNATKPKKEEKPKPEKEEKPKPEKEEKPKPEKEEKPTRKTRSTKKPKEPEPEEDLGEVYGCPGCGGDWPEKLRECPNPDCDEVAEEEEEEAASPSKKRGGEIPFDVEK